MRVTGQVFSIAIRGVLSAIACVAFAACENHKDQHLFELQEQLAGEKAILDGLNQHLAALRGQLEDLDARALSAETVIRRIEHPPSVDVIASKENKVASLARIRSDLLTLEEELNKR